MEYRLRVFGYRVPRRTFGPKRKEITGEWRRLHNKKTEMDRACSTYGERRSAYRGLMGKPEGRRPLGRPRR